MDSILKVTDLNLKIPERTLFSNLSFEIPRGKLTCITGENGVGKTTLIKHLLADLAHDYEEHAKFMVSRDQAQNQQHFFEQEIQGKTGRHPL